ncbi:MAG TPA: hypothetical protein VGW75_16670 [Solirubrobacteraceae bacterium]|jgi:hypothetical protein|nr:hypothetical protein [Solirubrobacteraceae bacterium]
MQTTTKVADFLSGPVEDRLGPLAVSAPAGTGPAAESPETGAVCSTLCSIGPRPSNPPPAPNTTDSPCDPRTLPACG